MIPKHLICYGFGQTTVKWVFRPVQKILNRHKIQFKDFTFGDTRKNWKQL